MNLPVASRKCILILWAFAICWFYIGSLINFHQHHIWGKSLIPQINSCSRNKSKIAPGYGNDDTAGYNLSSIDFNSDIQTLDGFAFLKPSGLITSLYSIPAHPCIPNDDGFAFSQLRGPPQA
jgi:hypothetical protein